MLGSNNAYDASNNTGDHNGGNNNTGSHNLGDKNTGHGNTLNNNAGNHNQGCWCSGDFNLISYSSGAFNTIPQKMVIFNQTLDMTVDEFYERYNLSANILLTEWVPTENMSDQDKIEHPEYSDYGGFLRKFDFKDACAVWWGKLTDLEKQKWLTLPGFDPEIFLEITGITV